MARSNEKGIEYYLGLEYPYTVVADGDEFFVQFSDLPGCVTQVERGEEIHSMAQEVKELWLETAFEAGQRIPEPMSDEYSGKFVARIPKSLHRDLAVQAKREGMSLNSYVLYLLAERFNQSKDPHPQASGGKSETSISAKTTRREFYDFRQPVIRTLASRDSQNRHPNVQRSGGSENLHSTQGETGERYVFSSPVDILEWKRNRIQPEEARKARIN